MRKYLILYAIAATLVAVGIVSHYRNENRRLRENQTALLTESHTYRTTLGKQAATIQVLRLKSGELEELRRADADYIRSLNIRLRRVESISKSATVTTLNTTTAIQDTVWLHDTVRLFRWRDTWVEINGTIGRDSVECEVKSYDTLRQIVHRIPRRFLFIRYGTKALRQEIISSNPHTQIVCTDYIRIEK